MRGKACSASVAGRCSGITPAYAGKSHQPPVIHIYTLDHPRLCGEKAAVPDFSGRQKGSPPPMRGKEAPDLYRQQGKGITPAYAGKRSRYQRAAHL